MTWLPWMRDPDEDFGVPGGASRSRQGTAGVTATDVWLVETIYEAIAAQSWCASCGAPLKPHLQLLPMEFGRAPSWSVTVITRCRGWRRHRQVARADAGEDLQFGPFFVCNH